MSTLIAEHNRNVIEWAKCVNENKLIVCYMEDVKNVMNVHVPVFINFPPHTPQSPPIVVIVLRRV